MSDTNATVIAFVPGTTASELNFKKSFVTIHAWPNIMNPNVDFASKAVMAECLENYVDADIGGIVMNYPTDPATPCYQSLVDYMQQTAGFTFYTAGAASRPSAPQKLFYALPYDWRIDNALSANRVKSGLDDLANIYPDGNYDLYVVAHSNGGLVARYLLEQIRPSNSQWWDNLKGMVTLATPHLGSPLAWFPIVDQSLPGAGENSETIRFVANVVDSSKFPSTAELLPPSGQDFIFGPNEQDENIYEAATARSGDLYNDMVRFGVNIDNINTAAAFQKALAPITPPDHCPYHFLYGDDRPTLPGHGDGTAFTYVAGQATSATTFEGLAVASWPSQGDSVVPASSANANSPANVATSGFSGYSHGQMGGCDMIGHPEAIQAMLSICGVATPQKAAAAAE